MISTVPIHSSRIERPIISVLAMLLAASVPTLVATSSLPAAEPGGHLDIYFIDVEGGACTLFVSPAGESLVIDSGYPDNNGRDLKRILHVVRDVAGLKQIAHA